MYPMNVSLRYEAGDHVAIFPKNDTAIVEKIGKRLGMDLDTVITLTNVDGELPSILLEFKKKYLKKKLVSIIRICYVLTLKYHVYSTLHNYVAESILSS